MATAPVAVPPLSNVADLNPATEPLGTPNPADLLPDSMPPAIARLMAATVPFEPHIEHELHRRKKANWELYLKLYELEPDELRELIQKHSPSDDPRIGEDPIKFEARKNVATAYNLIPLIVRMCVSYIYTEAPVIDVGGDADLAAFVADCDGNGTPLDHFIKKTVLPMAQVLGWVDVLVQNPLVSHDQVKSMQDQKDRRIAPTVYAIFPQDRINWSAKVNHEYNWVCFRESAGDDANPFRRNAAEKISYITFSAAMEGVEGLDAASFWIRSWMPVRTVGSGTPPLPSPPAPPGAVGEGEFQHVAGFAPTARVPVATLNWQPSADPKKRHYGISKVAGMAPLTVAIIQLLSYIMEDIKANLAILGLPTQDGMYPKDEDGKPVNIPLNPTTVVTFPHLSKHAPTIIQGNVSHIKAKIEHINGHIREILRLGNLLGASAEAERISSGVQGVVMRNELFRELKDGADSLDTFTMELLACAKSWLTGKNVTADQLKTEGKVSVRFFKGPYATEPLEAVIQAAASFIDLLRDVSPMACQKAYEGMVRSMIASDDPDLAKALKEIETNTGAALKLASMAQDAQQAEATATQDEVTMKNNVATDKRSFEANAG